MTESESGGLMTEFENKKRGKNEEAEIDLGKLFVLYLQHWWIILLCVVLGGLLMLGYTKLFVTPLYRASVTFYVNNSRNNQPVEAITASSLTASQQLVNTYMTIIKSETVRDKVAGALADEITAADLQSMISTAQVEETELFRVFVKHPDPSVAAEIANQIGKIAPKELENFVEGSSTKVIDWAKVPEERFSPSYTRKTELGALAGAAISILVITLIHVLDVRIKEESDLTELFTYPVLGKIPVIEGDAAAARTGVKKTEAEEGKEA